MLSKRFLTAIKAVWHARDKTNERISRKERINRTESFILSKWKLSEYLDGFLIMSLTLNAPRISLVS